MEIAGIPAERADRLRAGPIPPALSLFDVGRELRARGWTGAQYQAWRGRALREQFLCGAGTQS